MLTKAIVNIYSRVVEIEIKNDITVHSPMKINESVEFGKFMIKRDVN